MKVLVAGVKLVGGVASENGHRLELIRERTKGMEVFEVKPGNGNLAKCVIDLKASRWRERKGKGVQRVSTDGS